MGPCAPGPLGPWTPWHLGLWAPAPLGPWAPAPLHLGLWPHWPLASGHTLRTYLSTPSLFLCLLNLCIPSFSVSVGPHRAQGPRPARGLNHDPAENQDPAEHQESADHQEGQDVQVINGRPPLGWRRPRPKWKVQVIHGRPPLGQGVGGRCAAQGAEERQLQGDNGEHHSAKLPEEPLEPLGEGPEATKTAREESEAAEAARGEPEATTAAAREPEAGVLLEFDCSFATGSQEGALVGLATGEAITGYGERSELHPRLPEGHGEEVHRRDHP